MARPTDIRRVITARFLSRAGSEAAFFVGVWGKAAFDLKATPAQLAVVMFVLSTVAILGSITGGLLVDRYGPRRVLIAAEVLFVPAALAIGLADDLLTLTVLVAIWGLVGMPVQTAGASLAPYLAEDDGDLARMNSWIEAAGSAAFVTGPVMGSLIVRYASIDWVFYIDAVTSLVAALIFMTVKIKAPKRAPERGHPMAEFKAGIKATYGKRSLRFYVLGGTIAWLGFGAFGALEPLFYRDVVGTSVEAIGYMNSIFGVGILLGALALQRMPRKVISARGLAITMFFTGLGTIAYVGSADLRIIAVGALVWGAVIGVLEPLLRTLLHRDAPVGMVGRITGAAQVHRQAGELVPLAFAPALAAAFGVQATLIAGGVLVATVSALGLAEASAIDREARARVLLDVPVETLKVTDEPISPNP
ncbi:MAG: MFS transporter [Coriobacteriia bacterium]